MARLFCSKFWTHHLHHRHQKIQFHVIHQILRQLLIARFFRRCRKFFGLQPLKFEEPVQLGKPRCWTDVCMERAFQLQRLSAQFLLLINDVHLRLCHLIGKRLAFDLNFLDRALCCVSSSCRWHIWLLFHSRRSYGPLLCTLCIDCWLLVDGLFACKCCNCGSHFRSVPFCYREDISFWKLLWLLLF